MVVLDGDYFTQSFSTARLRTNGAGPLVYSKLNCTFDVCRMGHVCSKIHSVGNRPSGDDASSDGEPAVAQAAPLNNKAYHMAKQLLNRNKDVDVHSKYVFGAAVGHGAFAKVVSVTSIQDG